MAFSTTIEHTAKPAAPKTTTPANDISDALFSMIILSVYGAQMSKKTLRKMKRKFFWNSLKLKAKSLFSKNAVSDRTLLYIILGVVLLALLFVDAVLVLVLALIALILILLGVI